MTINIKPLTDTLKIDKLAGHIAVLAINTGDRDSFCTVTAYTRENTPVGYNVAGIRKRTATLVSLPVAVVEGNIDNIKITARCMPEGEAQATINVEKVATDEIPLLSIVPDRLTVEEDNPTLRLTIFNLGKRDAEAKIYIIPEELQDTTPQIEEIPVTVPAREKRTVTVKIPTTSNKAYLAVVDSCGWLDYDATVIIKKRQEETPTPHFSIIQVYPEEVETTPDTDITILVDIVNNGKRIGKAQLRAAGQGVEAEGTTTIELKPMHHEIVPLKIHIGKFTQKTATLKIEALNLDTGKIDSTATVKVIEIEKKPNFKIEKITPETLTVKEGETYTVQVTVRNTGTEKGTCTIKLSSTEAHITQIELPTLELSPQETKTAQVRFRIEKMESSTALILVEALDDTTGTVDDTKTITIEKEETTLIPRFKIVKVEPRQIHVEPGQQYTLFITIENTSIIPGKAQIQLLPQGAEIEADTSTLLVLPGKQETTTATFTVKTIEDTEATLYVCVKNMVTGQIDDTAQVTLIATPNKPRFRIVAVTYRATPTTTTIYVTVKNIGDKIGTARVQIIERTKILDEADTVIDRKATATVKLTAQLQPGHHTLTIRVINDTTGTVDDTKTITITVPQQKKEKKINMTTAATVTAAAATALALITILHRRK